MNVRKNVNFVLELVANVLPLRAFAKKSWEIDSDLLGPPILSTKTLGKISHYMVERFGFDPECLVTAFTGDNQASLAGIGLRPGELCISLGTSDTVMAWLENVEPQLMGHIWPNPVDSKAFMALLW